MSKTSAGLLLFRYINNYFEALIAHPGGPFWSKKNAGAWSIPKGEFNDDEKPLNAAIREFKEETGQTVTGNFIELSPIKQRSNKIVYCFAIEYEMDETKFISNTFKMEWPPKSGIQNEFPEIDKLEWCDYKSCKERLIPAQIKLIEELLGMLENK